MALDGLLKNIFKKKTQNLFIKQEIQVIYRNTRKYDKYLKKKKRVIIPPASVMDKSLDSGTHPPGVKPLPH